MEFVLEKTAEPFLLLYLAAAFCLLYVLLKVTQLYRKRQQLLKVFGSFPGPPSHLAVWPQLSDDELNKMLSWAKEYPYAYPRWIGGFIAFLVVNHPDYAKAVFGHGDSEPTLSDWIQKLRDPRRARLSWRIFTVNVLTDITEAWHIDGFEDYTQDLDPKAMVAYKFVIPWIGKGLVLLHGPKWFQHRRLLTPAFHYDVLKSYVPLMADSVQVMLNKWEKLVTLDKSVELFEHVSLMTLDTIMKCAFSFHSNCQTESYSNSYIKAVYDLTYLVWQRICFFPFHNDFIYRLSPQGHRFQEACRVARLHTENVIKERKKSLQDQQKLEKTQKKKCLDFLDILLSAKDENGVGLSDEDLRAEVETFMFGGHDTSASGISWLLYCMALHPEHQQRCREEIQEILGNRDAVQWDDLAKMTYSTMCIKESLRLCSPVQLASRQLIKPITFFDGRTLPEGSLVVVNIYAIHRNPNVWQDPEVFDPMRFSPENSSKRHPYAFLPFAAGARNCIGQQFAMNKLKVALALTLLRFELSPDPAKPPKAIPQLVLKSSTGIHLLLKKLH